MKFIRRSLCLSVVFLLYNFVQAAESPLPEGEEHHTLAQGRIDGLIEYVVLAPRPPWGAVCSVTTTQVLVNGKVIAQISDNTHVPSTVSVFLAPATATDSPYAYGLKYSIRGLAEGTHEITISSPGCSLFRWQPDRRIVHLLQGTMNVKGQDFVYSRFPNILSRSCSKEYPRNWSDDVW